MYGKRNWNQNSLTLIIVEWLKTLTNSVFRRLADSKSVHVLFNLSSNVTRFAEYILSNFFSSMQLLWVEKKEKEKPIVNVGIRREVTNTHTYIEANFCSISHSKDAYFALISSRKSTVLLLKMVTDISILLVMGKQRTVLFTRNTIGSLSIGFVVVK